MLNALARHGDGPTPAAARAPSTNQEPTAVGRKLPRRFLVGAGIDSFGAGLYLASSTLYFSKVVGFGAVGVGLALSVANMLGLLCPVPIGRLTDRQGLTTVYLSILVLRGIGYVAYPLTANYAIYFIMTCLLRAGDQSTPPLQQSLIGRLVEGKARIAAMATMRAIRNVALSLGFLVAGVALATPSRVPLMLLMMANGGSFLVLACIMRTVRAPQGLAEYVPPTTIRAADGLAVPALRNLPFLSLTAVNSLLLLHDSMLFVLLPLWVVARTPLSPSAVAGLLTLNTMLTIVLQLVLPKIQASRRPNMFLLAAAVSLVTACATFACTERLRPALAIAIVVVAVVLLTLGENAHSISSWHLSFELAPAARRSEYLATFSLSMGLQGIVGPILMTSVVLPHPALGWPSLAVLFAASALLTPPLARRSHYPARPRHR